MSLSILKFISPFFRSTFCKSFIWNDSIFDNSLEVNSHLVSPNCKSLLSEVNQIITFLSCFLKKNCSTTFLFILLLKNDNPSSIKIPLFGKVKAVSCVGATHIKERVDEEGKVYKCTADDAAYATFELEGGLIAQFNSSWCVRVRRDDLLTIQVDGTKGSAVAGLRQCYTQHYGDTPKPVWNPDMPQSIDFFRD